MITQSFDANGSPIEQDGDVTLYQTDQERIVVAFTRAEATQLLALALQSSIADRTSTVTAQLTRSVMRKLDGAL